VLNGGVSASDKVESAEQCFSIWCFSIGENDEGLSMVFQQREKVKQLLDGVVSSMKYGEEMVDCSVLGVGKEKVLNSGVSASGKCEGCCQWCFSNRRGKAKQLLDGVVSSMKDGEEMVDCSVLGVGKKKSVEQWCFSIGK
jgi:hypothetical protein